MIEIKIGDNLFSESDFVSFSISKSIFSLVGFCILNYKVRQDINKIPDSFKVGNMSSIKILDKKIIDGYIDSIRIIQAEDFYTIEIIILDKTCDLVDCTWNGSINEFKDITILDILNYICQFYGIKINVNSSISSVVQKTVTKFKMNEGEFIYYGINRLLSNNNLIAICKENGNLYITNSLFNEKIDYQFNETNTYKWEYEISNRNRFSEYFFEGIGYSSDNKLLQDYIQPYGSIEDLNIKRRRTFSSVMDSECNYQICTDRAKAEKNFNAANSRKIKVNCDRILNDKILFEIGKTASFKNSDLKIDSSLLIAEIVYNYAVDRVGFSSVITAIDKNIFNINDTILKTGFDL